MPAVHGCVVRKTMDCCILAVVSSRRHPPAGRPRPRITFPRNWVEGSGKPTELRAVWLHDVAFNNAAAQDATLRKLKRAGLNTVFLKCPKGGDNPGWSPPRPLASSSNKLQEERTCRGHHRLPLSFTDSRNLWTSLTPSSRQPSAVGSRTARPVPVPDGVTLGFHSHGPVGRASKVLTDGVTNTVRKIHDAIGAKYPGKLLSCAGFPGESRPTVASAARMARSSLVGRSAQWLREWYAANPDNYSRVWSPRESVRTSNRISSAVRTSWAFSKTSSPG